MADTEQGSEELSITSARFSRTTDLKLYGLGKSKYGRINHSCISDIARLSKDKLIIVDNSSRRCSVVTFAGPSTGQIDYINLPGQGSLRTAVSSPRIAVSPHNRAFVSSPDVLFFLSTSPTLTVLRAIDLHKPCLGVGFADNHLVLNFKDSIGIRGCVKGWQSGGQNVIVKGQGGDSCFRNITDVKVVIENGNPVIYVADTPGFDTTLLTKLSIRGDVLATYNDLEIVSPSGICPTGDGNVLVCNTSGNSILVLSPGMRDAKVVLDAKDGIRVPQAICFCPEEKKLFVKRCCNGNCIPSCNMLMVFDMQ